MRLIRHPAAFAASLKEQSRIHPFAHLQPFLMQHHLRPFAEESLRFTREERDIVEASW